MSLRREGTNVFDKMIESERKRHDPFIGDVLQCLDWTERLTQRGSKPWIHCRDENGMLYTLYPYYDSGDRLVKNMTIISKDL